MKAEGIDTHAVGHLHLHRLRRARPGHQPGRTLPGLHVHHLPAEVAVDTQTGKVKVEKFTAVTDCGTILNKLAVDGNFYGGLVQGIGLALTEDFEDLKKHTTLMKCGIPYPADVPDDIEVIYQENHPRPNGPYGASGCGEAPLDAPHPAILNAIYNATGARITRVPALPEGGARRAERAQVSARRANADWAVCANDRPAGNTPGGDFHIEQHQTVDEAGHACYHLRNNSARPIFAFCAFRRNA